MIPIIVTSSLGLAAIGFFRVLKEKANKGKLGYLPFLIWGHIMCVGLFAVAICGVSIQVLEKFFPIWIAGLIGLGGSVLLMITLFKLADRELKKLKGIIGGSKNG